MTHPGNLAQQVAQALWQREGTSKTLGIRLLFAAEGQAIVSMVVLPQMLNGHETAHGGLIFTLADTAFAYACNSANERTVAQAATIAFLSPAKLGEELTARAERIGQDGRTGSYAAVVRAADDRIIATFHGLSRQVGGSIIEDEDIL